MSGEGGLCFAAPASLLSQLSVTLDTLVGKSMGNPDIPVILETKDQDAFRCFFQFVYTGSYTCLSRVEDGELGENSHISSHPREVAATAQSKAGSLFGSGLNSSYSENFKLPYSLVSYKVAADQPRPTPSQTTTGLFGAAAIAPDPPSATKDLISSFLWNHGYRICYKSDSVARLKAMRQAESVLTRWTIGDSFVTHVKIWCFARNYSVSTLMDFAYGELATSLAEWVMFENTFLKEFGKLVRFVYNEAMVECSKLRELVAQFAACVMDDVWRLDGWLELLREVQDFVVDMVAASKKLAYQHVNKC